MTHTRVRLRGRFPLLAGAIVLALANVPSAGAQELTLASAPPTAAPTLEERLAAAEARVAELQAENDRLRDAVTSMNGLATPMEADRQLLLELRKTLPEDRPSAEAYLERLHRLSAASDPARLGQPADRVLENAAVFLDWRDQAFGSQLEADQAFAQSGAVGFGLRFEEFRDAVLLTVANRLDALLTLRDRVG
jgi:hypothetical protein